MKRSQSILALVLLVPAPSLGVLAGMILAPGTPVGITIFAASKVWLLTLPLFWLLWVEREPIRLSPMRKGGMGMGLLSGILLSAVILVTYWAIGHRLVDPAAMAARIAEIGLASPLRFAAGALYWVAVNSVLEEYVWRWFCVKQCRIVASGPVAIVYSALFFTLHHTLALSTFLPLPATIICSGGVFLGGAVWSGMFLRYQSIWPGYLSHAIVDLAIFSLGAAIVFGG